ncbi:MAG TPA: thioredoxin domain-containing protein [Nannocystaceae bacterium]|nr:thioredoxin domain-containing protein [Nannocystaceae bacterium]
MPRLRQATTLALALVACNDPYHAAPIPAPAASSPAATTIDLAKIREHGNHLVGEASPYLQQHAHNPVDWWPWGPEALAKAKAEKKPIFLSIGYSTCHWCHVMERESFDDDEVATFLNQHFVAIKVDREQRPDVDALYLEAVAAMGGSTGWPLNVFLTPELMPIIGGTYYPKNGDGRRPGFLELAREVDTQWRTQGEAAASKGRDIVERIAKLRPRNGGDTAPNRARVDEAIAALARARDDARGGFGSRQKFPNVPALTFELRWASRGSDEAHGDAREHVITTLQRMRDGGLRDQLDGSFHRYTVDPQWHVPHFEKTLYDNTQLAALYLEAARVLGDPSHEQVARAVLDDLLAHWQLRDGGFIVGFDADDAGGEGTYYTWTRAELDAAFDTATAASLALVFDLGEAELDGRSVLQRIDRGKLVRDHGEAIAAEHMARVDRALPELLRVRAQRSAPARDDKVLVAWNALAIATLADAGRRLNEPRYVEAAMRAAKLVHERCRDGDRLQRGVRGDQRLGPGFVDDHAALGLALLRLHAATGDLEHVRTAMALAQEIRTRFWDDDRGAFRHGDADDRLPAAPLDMDDGALPSGGALATQLWLELGLLTGDAELDDAATKLLARRGASFTEAPLGAGAWLTSLEAATADQREVVIAGDDPQLLDVLRDADPGRVLVLRIPAEGAREDWPNVAGKKALGGKPTAFVCERGSCKQPTSDPAVLRQQITRR